MSQVFLLPYLKLRHLCLSVCFFCCCFFFFFFFILFIFRNSFWFGWLSNNIDLPLYNCVRVHPSPHATLDYTLFGSMCCGSRMNLRVILQQYSLGFFPNHSIALFGIDSEIVRGVCTCFSLHFLSLGCAFFGRSSLNGVENLDKFQLIIICSGGERWTIAETSWPKNSSYQNR